MLRVEIDQALTPLGHAAPVLLGCRRHSSQVKRLAMQLGRQARFHLGAGTRRRNVRLGSNARRARARQTSHGPRAVATSADGQGGQRTPRRSVPLGPCVLFAGSQQLSQQIVGHAVPLLTEVMLGQTERRVCPVTTVRVLEVDLTKAVVAGCQIADVVPQPSQVVQVGRDGTLSTSICLQDSGIRDSGIRCRRLQRLDG